MITGHFWLILLIPFNILGQSAGATPKETEVLMRMKFVPGGPSAKGSSDYAGASFTNLGPGPEKGVLWCQAHAGVGDEFPVIDAAGVKLFDVRLVEGDDDRVLLEITAKEGKKKIDLPRDKARTVEVAGVKYTLCYPSVSVGAAPSEKPTTNKAMLMVTRLALTPKHRIILPSP